LQRFQVAIVSTVRYNRSIERSYSPDEKDMKMTVDKSKFVPAYELLDMIQAVVNKNPEALILMPTDNGSGYLVIDSIEESLDSDGDARFGVRDYETGQQVEVVETEDLPYQS
jgi:hypothetical protein